MPKPEIAADVKTTAGKMMPRTPRRRLGVMRYAALLDAADALLREASPAEVGLYQIAERAGVPPASVYHFFPTKEAAFLALTRRYLDEFRDLTGEPVDYSALYSWQGLMAWDQRRSVEYYNEHSPALKLFYGGFGGIETRREEWEFNSRVGHWTSVRLNSAFHMPFLRDPERKFHINLSIIESIWAISYIKHGYITADYRDEALAAGVAYCRLFLPEQTELRDEHRAAMEMSQPIVLGGSHVRDAHEISAPRIPALPPED